MKTKPFNMNDEIKIQSTQLKIGEMMRTEDPDLEENGILLRIYNGYVLLNNLNKTWGEETAIFGTKLKSGEGITLIQD